MFNSSLLTFERRFNKSLTKDELDVLSQKDFIDYLRENLWDRLAKKEYKKKWDKLAWVEKNHVDLLSLIEIGKAFEKVKRPTNEKV